MSVLCVVAIISSFLASSKENARATAQAIAEEQANIAISQKLASISTQLIQKNPQLAFLISLEALKREENPQTKRVILENINYSPLLKATINGHTSKITSLAFSKSGEFIAIGDASGYITTHNIQNGEQQLTHEFNAGHEILFLEFIKGDTQIISGTNKGIVQIWNLSGNSSLDTFKITSNASYFTYMGIVGENILVAEDSNSNLLSIDLTSQKILLQKDIDAQRGAYTLSTSETQDSILVLNENDVTIGRYYKISPISGKEISPPKEIRTYVFLTSLALSNDQKYLATGGCNTSATSPCFKGAFDIWNTETGINVIPTNAIHNDTITAMAFSPNNNFFASASGGSTNPNEKISILLWSLNDASGYPFGSQIGWPLYGHQAEVGEINFSPNNHYIASGDNNGVVLIWDLHNNSLYVKGNTINFIELSSDGTTLLASGDSPLPYQTSAEVFINLELTGEIKGYAEYACDNDSEYCGTWLNQKKISNEYPRLSISFLNQKTPIVEVNLENKVMYYNLINNEEIILPKEYPYLTLIQNNDTDRYLIAEYLDNNLIKQSKIIIPSNISGGFSYKTYNNTIYIYNREVLIAFDLKGRKKGEITISGRVTDDINIIPEKNLLLGTWHNYSERSVVLWDLTSFSKISQLDGQRLPTYSPAKGIIATVDTNSNFVNLWSINGKKIFSFSTKETLEFQNLIFSNDGNLLAGNQSTKLSIWDISSLDLISEFDIVGEFEVLAFSADNNILLAGGCAQARYRISDGCLNGKIQLYYLNTQNLINLACKLAGRNMTKSEWNDYIGDEIYQSTCPQWAPGK